MTTATTDYPKELTKALGKGTESGFWAKKELQRMIRDVKKQGVEVVKEGMAYYFYLTSPKGKKHLVMVALNGKNNYLVRSVKDWLSVS